MLISGGKKKREVGLEDALAQYYEWKYKQTSAEKCAGCKGQSHQMNFEEKIMENGDRHLFAKCPNIDMEINMGRHVHITKTIEARELARIESRRLRISQHLNQVFEYSKNKTVLEPDIIPSNDQLANLYIYENPKAVDTQSIRRQMTDLHENAANIDSYEEELGMRVKEWMRLSSQRNASMYLPGNVRGVVSRRFARDANSIVKFPFDNYFYMHHYTSDPASLSVSIGSVPMVIRS